MHVDEVNTPLLKKWIVKRLEDISDADSDVLADYVLALVKSEDPDSNVRSNCLENLEDFLRGHTEIFVDDVFRAIRTKAYLPGCTSSQPPPPSHISFNTSSDFSIPREGTGANAVNYGPSNGNGGQSRKRAFNEGEGSGSRDVRDPHYGRNSAGERSIKLMRKAGNRTVIGNIPGAQSSQPSAPGLPGLGNVPSVPIGSIAPMESMPNPPPGFPSFDPNSPLTAIMAMQAMGLPPLPGFPPFSMASAQTGFPTGGFHVGTPGHDMPPKKIGERCNDYDTKGFCALGSACAYEHGLDHMIVQGQTDEYDPRNSSLSLDNNRTNGQLHEPHRGSERGRGRGRGRGDRLNPPGAKGARASFSQTGPNHDRSITTVVVEQIPEDKFSEQSVCEFFSEFGIISEVTMQPYKRLALVKFNDYHGARRAYDSPKVIFDNRFVKVYWYKPDAPPANKSNGAKQVSSEKHDDEIINKAEFEKKQVEAQKAYEEKLQRTRETEAQREELERKLKVQSEERKKLIEKLAAKTTGKATDSVLEVKDDVSMVNGGLESSSSPPVDSKSAVTGALKLKLAELEAEAESMGISPEDPWAGHNASNRGRGRGTYLGRGAYPSGRRGYDSSFRGSYRGRGSGYAGGSFGSGRGGVMRLDNRSKKVSVSGVEFGTQKDEALRQYLFNNYEFESIEPHAERKDVQIVTFKERYVAETFIVAAANDIPVLGRLELSWVNTSPASVHGATATKDSVAVTSSSPAVGAKIATSGNHHLGVTISGSGVGASSEGSVADVGRGPEVDYDVADDEDRWMSVT